MVRLDSYISQFLFRPARAKEQLRSYSPYLYTVVQWEVASHLINVYFAYSWNIKNPFSCIVREIIFTKNTFERFFEYFQAYFTFERFLILMYLIYRTFLILSFLKQSLHVYSNGRNCILLLTWIILSLLDIILNRKNVLLLINIFKYPLFSIPT